MRVWTQIQAKIPNDENAKKMGGSLENFRACWHLHFSYLYLLVRWPWLYLLLRHNYKVTVIPISLVDCFVYHWNRFKYFSREGKEKNNYLTLQYTCTCKSGGNFLMLAPAFLSFIMSSFLISSRSRRHVIKVKGLQLYFCVCVYFPGWFSTRCCKLGTRLWTNSRNGNCRTHGSWQNCFHWLNWGKPCIQDCVNSYMNTCRLRAVSFSSYLVRGVHAREKRGRQPERPLPSRTLSNPRGQLCVSNVLLDGPRKKRDCS